MNHVITLGGLLKFFGITALILGVLAVLVVKAVNYMSDHWQ